MKKLRRFSIACLIFFVCMILVIMYFVGFRITYVPNLENSWNAISACASWFSVITSAIAIFVAINIPKKIALQQDKISLFEKRYSTLNSFTFLMSVTNQIIDLDIQGEEHKNYLDNMISTYNSVSIIRELTSDVNPKDVYVRLLFEAGKVQYLFKLEEMQIVIDFFLMFNQYISDAYSGRVVDESVLHSLYNKLLENEILEKLERQLNI